MSAYMNKQDLIKELLKCGNDPVYFIKHYAKIAHPQKGVIPFKLWPFQEILLDDFLNFQNNIINKSRQLGISTLTAAYCAWLILFHEEKNIMVIATKLQVAQNLVRKVKLMIKQLDPMFKKLAQISTDNKQSFELTNGSSVKASPTNITAGRSEALSLLVIDEAAHVEGLNDLWTAMGPTLAAGGRCIALSSPNGQGGWFYENWMKAVNGENDFHPTELMWNVHPDRDQKWFEAEKKRFNKREFAQEYLCSFNASGETVISPENIEWISSTITQPLIQISFEESLWIWERNEISAKYMIFADVARGDGTDFSAFHVIKNQGMRQVAEFRAKINTDNFSKLLFDIGLEYGQALIVCENNSYGHEVNNTLIRLGYPNLYWEKKSDRSYVPQYRAKYSSDAIAGFSTTTKTREWIIGKFEEYIRNKKINIKSKRLLQEINTFIWRNGKAEAMKGKNDDLVMCFAIACYVCDNIGSFNKSAELKKLELSSLIKSSKYSTKFDTKMPGMKGYNSNLSLIKKGKQQIEERKKYKWLFTG